MLHSYSLGAFTVFVTLASDMLSLVNTGTSISPLETSLSLPEHVLLVLMESELHGNLCLNPNVFPFCTYIYSDIVLNQGPRDKSPLSSDQDNLEARPLFPEVPWGYAKLTLHGTLFDTTNFFSHPLPVPLLQFPTTFS